MELAIGYGRGASFIAESGALETPFILIDIGVRDGIHPRWRPFEPALHVYGFDPIADVPAPNDRHHYFKLAIGATDGTCAFHVPDNLYEARASADGECRVPMARLDTLWEQQNLPAADFIKIDVEGHEPDVLRGAERYLAASNLLGADIETSFHVTPVHPQSHFVAIKRPMVTQRLLVAELAFCSARDAPWTGTCNALFARHLVHEHRHGEHYSLRPAEAQPSLDAILKTIAILDVYALHGPAMALVRRFSDAIAERIDPDQLYRLLAPPRGPLTIERFLPHLGLGIWSGLKRAVRYEPRRSPAG